MMLPPKGRFVSSRVRLTRLWISSTGKPRPRTRSPPASETAAASSGTAEAANPTFRIGCSIWSRSQSGVRRLTGAKCAASCGIVPISPSFPSLEVFERLTNEDFAYLTTTGRRSGRAHTVEIWFAFRDGRVYLLSGGGDRADWVRNLRKDPTVRVRIGTRSTSAKARVLRTGTPEDRLA